MRKNAPPSEALEENAAKPDPPARKKVIEPRVEKLLVYDLPEKKLYQPLDIQKFVSEARGYLWR